MLTIKEISKRLQIPESTLRWYANHDKLIIFFPTVGEGRKRRFKPEALNVFRFIVATFKEVEGVDNVAERLAQEFPTFEDVSKENSVSSTITPQQQIETVIPIADNLLTLYAQQEQRITQLERMMIIANEQAIAAREEAIAAKEYIDRSLNERDRVLMEHIRTLQDKRPWWKWW